MMSWTDLHKPTYVIFGITQKLLYITSSNLLRQYINQLLSMTHDIFTSFDSGLEGMAAKYLGVFLDISKAFHKVWHDGLIS